MLVFDPPSVIELMWGTDRLRIELQADGDGTVLTLTDTFGELGKAARDAAGWHECLDRLVRVLDGDALPEWGDVWRAVHPRYVDALGPDASTIGPPRGLGGRHARVVDGYVRSKRSRFMTLSHAATKSCTNFSLESSHA